MNTVWVLAADSSRARIFEMDGRRGAVRELQDFAHPEGRARGRDLRSDARGRYSGGGEQQGHSASEPTDPVEHDTELFAKMLGDFLDKARAENRFVELVLIAPPKFLGMLRRSLSREAQKLVKAEIPKQLSRLDASEIEGYVKGAQSQ